MKVTLNIAEDAELRSAVKDMIKGQVLAVVREEILEIVKEELTRNLKGRKSPVFEQMVNRAIVDSVEKILRDDFGVATWNREFIKPIIDNYVSVAVAGIDWKTAVDKVASEKIRTLSTILNK